MRGVLLTLALVGVAASAQVIDPNRPILLTGPDAYGSTLAESIDVAKLAAANGYNGISVGIGLRSMSDPNKISVSGVRTLTREALARGLKYICFRLDQVVPANQAWANKFNGGVIWNRLNRPPSGTWNTIAQMWQVARNVAADECVKAGKDPATSLIFVLTNEPGIGGAGGPCYDTWTTSRVYYNNFLKTGDQAQFLLAFPPELLGKPEGYIEPQFWAMLRYLRSRVSFKSKVFCVSFEGATPGQMPSTTGPDATWIYANCNGFGFTTFAPNAKAVYNSTTGALITPALTPAQCADGFRTRVNQTVAGLRTCPLLVNKQAIMTEYNLVLGRVPTGADSSVYRREVLRTGMSYPGLFGSAVHTAFSLSLLSPSGYEIFRRVFVNGVPTYPPYGSFAVGPNTLNELP